MPCRWNVILWRRYPKTRGLGLTHNLSSFWHFLGTSPESGRESCVGEKVQERRQKQTEETRWITWWCLASLRTWTWKMECGTVDIVFDLRERPPRSKEDNWSLWGGMGVNQDEHTRIMGVTETLSRWRSNNRTIPLLSCGNLIISGSQSRWF